MLQERALPVSCDPEGKKKLGVMLNACFQSQKIYGKEPESIKGSIQVFNMVLGDCTYEDIRKAFGIFLSRSSEMPTPADIAQLIRYEGKQPITESMYIAANAKDAYTRDHDDWETIKLYEEQQRDDGGW